MNVKMPETLGFPAVFNSSDAVDEIAKCGAKALCNGQIPLIISILCESIVIVFKDRFMAKISVFAIKQ